MAIEYRVRFEGRPDLDSNSFTDYRGRVAAGEEYDYEGESWRIDRVEPGTEDLPDLIVFVRIHLQAQAPSI